MALGPLAFMALGIIAGKMHHTPITGSQLEATVDQAMQLVGYRSDHLSGTICRRGRSNPQDDCTLQSREGSKARESRTTHGKPDCMGYVRESATLEAVDPDTGPPGVAHGVLDMSAGNTAALDSIYVASLLAPPETKLSPQDVWNNVRLPRLELLNGTADAEGWIPTPEITAPEQYVAMVGLPVAGKISPGSASFNLESSYLTVSCGAPQSLDSISGTFSSLGLIWQGRVNETAGLTPVSNDAEDTFTSFFMDTNLVFNDDARVRTSEALPISDEQASDPLLNATRNILWGSVLPEGAMLHDTTLADKQNPFQLIPAGPDNCGVQFAYPSAICDTSKSERRNANGDLHERHHVVPICTCQQGARHLRRSNYPRSCNVFSKVISCPEHILPDLSCAACIYRRPATRSECIWPCSHSGYHEPVVIGGLRHGRSGTIHIEGYNRADHADGGSLGMQLRLVSRAVDSVNDSASARADRSLA
ncbi:hypothetical protein M8818_002252 [Zalaria obscura]|uniref:Uncharacterized protein n=1 Tax=Zalaria obscura TaxID=2024903 RepID=A0ACC3SKA9_9PEZI